MSATIRVTLGTSSQHTVTLKSTGSGYWRSNVPWPLFATLHFPNGAIWDLATFGAVGSKENPWPIDEETRVELHYSGWVPPGGYPTGMEFLIVLNAVALPKR